LHCCGSWMFIPDPDFCPSRTSDPLSKMTRSRALLMPYPLTLSKFDRNWKKKNHFGFSEVSNIIHKECCCKVGNEKQSCVAASSDGWRRRFGTLQSSGWRSLAEAGQVQAVHLCHRTQAQQVIPGLCRGPNVCPNSVLTGRSSFWCWSWQNKRWHKKCKYYADNYIIS
jgi:hypothetical protein